MFSICRRFPRRYQEGLQYKKVLRSRCFRWLIISEPSFSFKIWLCNLFLITEGIAAQIGWNSWRMRLIVLAYWAALCAGFKTRFTAEPQRMSHAEIAETAESEIFLQLGDTDWRKRLLFSESSVSSSEAHEPLTWFGTGGREIMTIFPDLVLKRQKAFYLAVPLRQIKISSLRPRRLCGENIIFDKYDVISLFPYVRMEKWRRESIVNSINKAIFASRHCEWSEAI